MTMSAALLLYTFGILFIAVLAQLYLMYRDKTMHWEISRSRLCRCQSCRCVFLAKRQAQVARCPKCNGVGSINL